MAARRLLILPAGTCNLSESRVRRGGSQDTEVAIPMPIFAVDTDHGWLLFDTGCDPRVRTDPEAVWGRLASAFRVVINDEDTQLARLESIGLVPKQIEHVVISHLHMDHAGGMQLFTRSRIHIQK